MTSTAADSAFLAHLRSFVGTAAMPPRRAADEVNLPAIRRFVEAMGDRNPIYVDHEAARAAGRDDIVAPPAMLPVWTMDGYRASVAATTAPPRTRGVLGALAEAGFDTTPATNCAQRYVRELRLGDRLMGESVVADVSPEKHTAHGPAHFVSLRTTFKDRHDEIVGEQVLRVAAFNPSSPRREPSASQIRAATRDAAPATALPSLALPFDRLAVIACTTACNDFRAGHYDPAIAQRIGMRDIFTDIPTSTALVARYVTDWCGPRGRLRAVDVRLGIPFCAGDTLVLDGHVVDRTPDGVAEIAVSGTTEHGQHVTARVQVASS